VEEVRARQQTEIRSLTLKAESTQQELDETKRHNEKLQQVVQEASAARSDKETQSVMMQKLIDSLKQTVTEKDEEI